MKRISLLTAVTTISLSFGQLTAYGSSYDPLSIQLQDGYASISVAEDGGPGGVSQIAIQPPAPDENLNRGEWIFCETLEDPACDFTDPTNDIMGWVVLPPCESEFDENCVEPLEILVGENLVTGSLVGTVQSGQTYAENTRLRFYEASRAAIFNVPGVTHSGGTDNYLTTVRASVRYDHKLGYFTTGDVSASVTPYSAVNQDRFANTGVCVKLSQTECASAETFPDNVRPRVTVRISTEVGGWFFGRMQAPNISVSEFSTTNNRITVEADPVQVPRLNVIVPQDSLTLEDLKAIGNMGSHGKLGESPRVYIGNAANDETVFKFIEYYKPWVKDTAAGVTSLWSFKTIAHGPGNQCLADKSQVLGIVTTNALGYYGFSPQYNSGFLNYKVAGLHFAPDGKTPNLGTYDLVMKSDVARCLYGFSKAPVSATVTVTGAGGVENVATTVVSERDGWLKLAAYGFTFSEKEIKVQVTQAQTRTLTNYVGSTTALTAKQKAEIKATVTKGGANPKFICTGIRLEGQPQALNTLVRKRAKLACDYAKSLNPKLSTFYQTKTTKARSYNGKVLVVSK